MKTFTEQDGIGRARYTVSFHDGEKTHGDGSPFYDLRIFSRRDKRDGFVRQLRADGYVNV